MFKGTPYPQAATGFANCRLISSLTPASAAELPHTLFREVKEFGINS